MSTIQELLGQGFQLHRQNKLAEARQYYQQAHALDPGHAEVLNLLGMLGWQMGDFAQAVEYLRKAVAIDSSKPAYFANLAEAYRGLKHYDAAIENYQQAIRLNPQVAVAHLRLGMVFQEAAQFDRALECYERSRQIEPQRLETLIRMGSAYKRKGDLAAAEQCFRHASEAHPSMALVFFELGNVQLTMRRFDEAIASYRRALTLQPNYPEVFCNLGNALRERRQLDEAIVELRRAIELRPEMVEAIINLGTALQDLGRLDEAQSCFERALQLDPGRPELLLNMGSVLKDQMQVPAALDWFERALQAQPGNAQVLCNRGAARLSLGQFETGWADYEHRVTCGQYHMLRLSQPRWDGLSLEGRRLLVHCEQGFGDTLQFIRYLPMVRARVENVIVAADAPLIPLLDRSGYGPLVDKDRPLPPFDVQVPLMSLPHVFGTTLESIPADVPYLSVEQERIDRVRGKLEAYPGFRVGIAWQGRPNFRADGLRSIPLQHFAPLAGVEGVRLLSLQKGPGSEQLTSLHGSFDVVDLNPVLNGDGPFLDIAAAMQSLDLVVSSCTAIAHLAGALGVPVWLALSKVPDWRWMYDRDDSPWYPTMRLFRQTQLGQWSDVFERMAGALREQLQRASG